MSKVRLRQGRGCKEDYVVHHSSKMLRNGSANAMCAILWEGIFHHIHELSSAYLGISRSLLSKDSRCNQGVFPRPGPRRSKRRLVALARRNEDLGKKLLVAFCGLGVIKETPKDPGECVAFEGSMMPLEQFKARVPKKEKGATPGKATQPLCCQEGSKGTGRCMMKARPNDSRVLGEKACPCSIRKGKASKRESLLALGKRASYTFLGLIACPDPFKRESANQDSLEFYPIREFTIFWGQLVHWLVCPLPCAVKKLQNDPTEYTVKEWPTTLLKDKDPGKLLLVAFCGPSVIREAPNDQERVISEPRIFDNSQGQTFISKDLGGVSLSLGGVRYLIFGEEQYQGGRYLPGRRHELREGSFEATKICSGLKQATTLLGNLLMSWIIKEAKKGPG
eukprot:Gb_05107 [translate_table: standard]